MHRLVRAHPLVGVEIVLENDGRRRRIEPSLPNAPVLLAKSKSALGFATAEAFVLQDHRKAHPLFQYRSEGLNLASHGARGAVEVAWQADNNQPEAIVFMEKPGKDLHEFVEARHAKSANSD